MMTSCQELARRGEAPRRPGSDASERNRHVQVTRRIPDRARHPGRDHRDDRAGLALESPCWRWSSCSPSTRLSRPACRPHGGSAATPARCSGTCCSGWSTWPPGCRAGLAGARRAGPGPAVGIWAVCRPGGVLRRLRLRRAGRDPGDAHPGRARHIAFGVVLCARPGLGAVTFALLFGLFDLIAGTWMLAQGIELHRTGKTLHPSGAPTPGDEGGLARCPGNRNRHRSAAASRAAR